VKTELNIFLGDMVAIENLVQDLFCIRRSSDDLR
jgi:hypothetical protein